MMLSIIIPSFNEEKTIRKLLGKVISTNYVMPVEVVVVDNGSTDNTFKEIKKIRIHGSKKTMKIVRVRHNIGKGHGTRVGIQKSEGDFVIIQDADLEYNPAEINKLIDASVHKSGLGIAYGSRFLGNYEGMQPSNLIGNKILTSAANILFGCRLTDIETCYKLIPRKVIDSLDLKEDGFGIEAEITGKLLMNGFEIKDVPISYLARDVKNGKKVRFKDGVRSLIILLKIRFGRYEK